MGTLSDNSKTKIGGVTTIKLLTNSEMISPKIRREVPIQVIT